MSEPVINRLLKIVHKRIQPVSPDRNKSIGQAELIAPNRPVSKTASIDIQLKSNDRFPRLDRPGNPPGIARVAMIEINAKIAPATDETSYVLACGLTASEIERAVIEQLDTPHLWHNFEGLAIKATFGSHRPLINNQNLNEGVTIPLQIFYRTAENDAGEPR